jgi:uncharacterized protein Veg
LHCFAAESIKAIGGDPINTKLPNSQRKKKEREQVLCRVYVTAVRASEREKKREYR